MHRVQSQIDGTLRAGEPVNSDAALGRKVPHRSSAGEAVDDKNVGWEFVGGVYQAPGPLEPGLNPLRAGQKIPAKNDRRETHPGKRTPAHKYLARSDAAVW